MPFRVPQFTFLRRSTLWLGALSGLLQVTLFPKLSWSWLCWIALIPLLYAMARSRRASEAFWAGQLAGMAFFAGSCPWIYSTIQRYGGLSPALAGFVLFLFAMLMGLSQGVFAWLGYWLQRRGPAPWLTLAAWWTAVELLRTYLPMGGFPWNLLGYAEVNHAGFMLLAPIGGVYLLSFVIALVNSILADLLLQALDLVPRIRPRRTLITQGVLLFTILGFATFPYHPPSASVRPYEAVLVQPNVKLNEHWTAGHFQALLDNLRALSSVSGNNSQGQTSQGGHALVIWPEAPAPLEFDQQPQLALETEEIAGNEHVGLLFGETSFGPPETNGELAARNSAMYIRPSGMIGGRYDKQHLVPFGEYVPLPLWLQQLADIGKLVQGVGAFYPGSGSGVFPLNGHSFGVLICYESVFPSLARSAVMDGSNFLVNISDDGWYGNSSARWQSLAMTRVRAMENRRWILRDTNDGVTAVIDPYGRVRQQLPVGVNGVLHARFNMNGTRTLYTLLGDWPAYLCAIMSVFALLSCYFKSQARAARQENTQPEALA